MKKLKWFWVASSFVFLIGSMIIQVASSSDGKSIVEEAKKRAQEEIERAQKTVNGVKTINAGLNSPPEPCVDTPPNKGQEPTKAMLSDIKNHEELEKYLGCYATDKNHETYLKSYKPVINKLSGLVKSALEADSGEEVNQMEIETVFTCLLYRESGQWVGGVSEGGAVGLAQFTPTGIAGLEEMLEKIKKFKNSKIDHEKKVSDFTDREALLEMKRVKDEEEKETAISLAEEALETYEQIHKVSELTRLSAKTKRTQEENKKLRQWKDLKYKRDVANDKRDEVDRNYTKESAKLSREISDYTRLKGITELWDEYTYVGKEKKPSLDATITIAYLKNNKNYETIFLFSILVMLNNYLDLDGVIKEYISRKETISGSELSELRPTVLEKFLGASGMYNLGINGFKERVVDFVNKQTNESEKNTKLVAWMNHLGDITSSTSLTLDKRAELINHLISIKRCTEKGLNQSPCGGETTRKEVACKSKLFDPPKRSACENKTSNRCVTSNEKLKTIEEYECTTP